MWSTGCLPLRGVARKPVKPQGLPTGWRAIASATLPIATALTAAFTSRGWPASTTSDSCSSRKSRAGKPAGVWRKAPISAMRAFRATWFTGGRAAAASALRLDLRLLGLARFLALDGLHHRRGAGIGLLLLHRQVAQHGVVEAECVLE